MGGQEQDSKPYLAAYAAKYGLESLLPHPGAGAGDYLENIML